jgi:hypothetical protein
MGKYLLLVGMNVPDKAKEKEFNDWYNTVHLPDVLEISEFEKATRWENIAPAEKDAKFLALYEIETPDIEATMKKLEETIGEKAKAGRMSNLGALAWRGTFKQIYTR